MEVAAAFLESRRYASLLGATTEFEKMEGLTFRWGEDGLWGGARRVPAKRVAAWLTTSPSQAPRPRAARGSKPP
jgi:hypothetical protein